MFNRSPEFSKLHFWNIVDKYGAAAENRKIVQISFDEMRAAILTDAVSWLPLNFKN